MGGGESETAGRPSFGGGYVTPQTPSEDGSVHGSGSEGAGLASKLFGEPATRGPGGSSRSGSRTLEAEREALRMEAREEVAKREAEMQRLAVEAMRAQKMQADAEVQAVKEEAIRKINELEARESERIAQGARRAEAATAGADEALRTEALNALAEKEQEILKLKMQMEQEARARMMSQEEVKRASDAVRDLQERANVENAEIRAKAEQTRMQAQRKIMEERKEHAKQLEAMKEVMQQNMGAGAPGVAGGSMSAADMAWAQASAYEQFKTRAERERAAALEADEGTEPSQTATSEKELIENLHRNDQKRAEQQAKAEMTRSMQEEQTEQVREEKTLLLEKIAILEDRHYSRTPGISPSRQVYRQAGDDPRVGINPILLGSMRDAPENEMVAMGPEMMVPVGLSFTIPEIKRAAVWYPMLAQEYKKLNKPCERFNDILKTHGYVWKARYQRRGMVVLLSLLLGRREMALSEGRMLDAKELTENQIYSMFGNTVFEDTLPPPDPSPTAVFPGTVLPDGGSSSSGGSAATTIASRIAAVGAAGQARARSDEPNLTDFYEVKEERMDDEDDEE